MIFGNVSKTFGELDKTSSRLEITALLARLFSQLSPTEIHNASYLLQGRVSPKYEKRDFGFADRLIFKAFVGAFSLAEKEIRHEWQVKGDLGEVVEAHRKTAALLFEAEKPLSVADVFAALYRLSDQSGTGSQDLKLGILADLLQQLDPLSCKYIVRIVTGKLRLGFSDMTILDAFSWMLDGDKQHRKEIERAYNVHPDLGFIGKTLKKFGVIGLKDVRPEPGVPILMARAERVPRPEDIFEKIGACAIEPKYDGFRLQIHLLKDKTVRIYSRNLDDVAYMYPDITDAVQRELGNHEVVIEGEAIGYDPKTDHYLPFQETVQRKRKYDIAAKQAEIPLRLFAFDLLYCDGVSFLTKGYTERKKKLYSMVSKTAQTIQITKEQVVTSVGEIERLFHKATAEGLEGIMAKKTDGIYEAGARGWNWIKFKHSYSSKLTDTIDCVVMGYDYGLGKRTNFGIGAFLAGVYDATHDKVVTVAKIGTGLTDEEWKYLRAQCDKHTVTKMPTEYDIKKEMKVDQWVSPVIIVEIRADELTRSTMHTASLALRFPRLERFRTDKALSEITELSEILTMFEAQKRVAL